MEEERCGLVCQAPEPYPPVRAEGRNPRYGAAMLDNMGGNCSEMSTVGRYLYAQMVTAGMPEVAEALRELSIVEMHHLHIFGTLAVQLGMDPRLWSVRQGRRCWWSPEYLQYPRRLGPILQYALREEQAAIRKYENQLRWIRDGSIVEQLRRILQDEQIHVELLTTLWDSYAAADLPPGRC